MIDVTFIILTKNEEINIVDCIDSIKHFASRIVIVDSGSTDKTQIIAKSMGAEIFLHPFENYSRQFNWAIENTNITTKWTFRLDADERLTPQLIRELETLSIKHDSDDVNGFTIEAWLYFLKKRINFGGRNKRKIMMFRTGCGKIEDRKMDEHTILSNGISVSCKNRFIHYDFKDLTHWINKMNWYATREMQDFYTFSRFSKENTFNFDNNVKNDPKIILTRKLKFQFYYRLPIFFRAWLVFIYFYLFRFGFLDGKEGFIYNYMYHKWYRTLVDAKILEQKITNKPYEETGDLK